MVRAASANEQVVLDLFAAISAKAYDQAAGLLDQEVGWTLMLVGMAGAGTHTGKAAVLRNLIAGAGQIFRKGAPKTVVETIVSAGDFVMAETRGTGERFDGLAYHNRYARAFELRQSLVFRVRDYTDSLYVSQFFDPPGGAG